MSYQAFSVSDLKTQQGDMTYREFLRRESMSLGLYHIPTRGTDTQHPHAADEVYIVTSGQGTLIVEGSSIEVKPGSVVSVDRGADHHFSDVTEDLTLLVIFAPPSTPES